MPTKQEAQKILNDLIETCKDGEQGFKVAAEKIKDRSLKALFEKYSWQRAQYVIELQDLVAQMGSDPATSGHISGALHRGWINLKEAFSRNDDQAIVDECEAGEDAAVKSYGDALKSQLPAEIATIVQRQYKGIQLAHAVVRDLKHGRAATAAATRI